MSVYTRTEPVTNLDGLRLTEDRTKPVYFDSLGVTVRKEITKIKI